MNQEKQILLDEIHNLKSSLEQTFPNSNSIGKLQRLLADIEEDYYTIVVVGEFKNGKSTFINSLLGEDLVPRDITPTTAAIHALFYREKPSLQVVYSNSDIEESELSNKALQRYTASGTYQADDINHIKVFTPAELLKNRVILVDTPGVNDVNEQRANVTHQFMPKADAVIFLTSLEAGIRSTEAEFLENYVLKNVSNLIYVANFMDRIDEDDIDETIEFVERRIQRVTKDPNAIIYPCSAKQALEGKLLHDNELLEESGISAIEKAIFHQLQAGEREKRKLARYSFQLSNTKHRI
jgi:GTPase Era involved in 16S rRNA processing